MEAHGTNLVGAYDALKQAAKLETDRDTSSADDQSCRKTVVIMGVYAMFMDKFLGAPSTRGSPSAWARYRPNIPASSTTRFTEISTRLSHHEPVPAGRDPARIRGVQKQVGQLHKVLIKVA